MTTGEPLVVRVAMKPISTLMRPLGTVDVATGEAGGGHRRAERRHRRAGDGRDRRGDGGVRARRGVAREVRRRLARRNAAQPRRLPFARRQRIWRLTSARAGGPAPGPRRAAGLGEDHGRAAAGRARCGGRSSTSTTRSSAARGCTVSEIFEQRGEGAFRAMERALTGELAGVAGMVLSPGGGWMADEGNVALLRPPARIIHLEVSVPTALARLGSGIQPAAPACRAGSGGAVWPRLRLPDCHSIVGPTPP